MQIAPIASPDILNSFTLFKTKYHLMLAHVDTPGYREYYRNRVRLGHVVILDNGTFEFGESVPVDLLLEVANFVRPQIIVLPDVLCDGDRTVRQAVAAASRLRHGQYMFVPQGKDLEEFAACATIGWNYLKHRIKLFGVCRLFLPDDPTKTVLVDRVEMLDCLRELSRSVGVTFHTHILGFERSLDSLSDYVLAACRDLRVVGIDTGGPVTLGLAGKSLLEPHRTISKIRKPEDFFSASLANRREDVLDVIESNYLLMQSVIKHAMHRSVEAWHVLPQLRAMSSERSRQLSSSIRT